MVLVTVNGDKYEVVQGDQGGTIEPGLLLTGINDRCAYRVVSIDGSDAILRNMRRPCLLEAEPVSSIYKYYRQILPVDSGDPSR